MVAELNPNIPATSINVNEPSSSILRKRFYNQAQSCLGAEQVNLSKAFHKLKIREGQRYINAGQ